MKYIAKRLPELLCLIGVLSFPLSAVAEGVKKPDPKRFAKDIQKFTEQDKKSPPTKGGIVFTGSSSIRLWDLKKAFPDLPVLNRGFGGSIANDLVAYKNEVTLRYKPKLLVVYTGSNDIHRGMTPEEVMEDYTKFLNAVHKKSPQTVVIVNPVKVSRSRIKQMPAVAETNALLKEWCAKRDWTVWVETAEYLKDRKGQPIDSYFVKDQLHLSEKGYAVWNEIITPVIRAEWAKPARHVGPYRPSLTARQQF